MSVSTGNWPVANQIYGSVKDCPKGNPRAVALNHLGPQSLWGL